MRELLRPTDAAQLLGVAPSTVYRLIGDGRLPSVAVGIRSTRIRREDLDAFIRERRVKVRRAQRRPATG